MKQFFKSPVFFIGIVFVASICSNLCFAQEIKMPSIFANQMVLQRDMEVPVWGSSNPNVSIVVEFLGQRKATIADENGNWKVHLDPINASSKPQVLTISAELNGKKNELKITDVLVGEVWFAGGQSNMYRPFRMLTYPARESKYEPIGEFLRNERDNAHDPLLRQFRVGRAHNVFQEQTEGRGNWSKAVGKDVNEICATAYFFAKELRRELNVPIAVISCNLGGTKIEPWMPMDAFDKNGTLKVFYKEEITTFNKRLKDWDDKEEKNKYEKELKEWEIKVKEAEANSESEPKKPRKTEHPNRDKQIASTLYNGMIHPIIPYAIKGALWYQGESNTGNNPEQYAMQLEAMVESWRKAWGNDFYFYYCQLANYRDANKEPLESDQGWAIIRDQMRLGMRIPKSGMAVLSDIGEAEDIHPKNKFDAGKRLSFWALNQAYGKDVYVSGPIYKSSKFKRKKVILSFDYAGSGLMVGSKNLMDTTVEVNEPLKRFQICGKNREWKWAKAKIVGKHKVEVWHPEILNPIEVRYAWSSNPEGANLYNKEGLPASAFKTSKN
jgi:sialate O-acetylesterase